MYFNLHSNLALQYIFYIIQYLTYLVFQQLIRVLSMFVIFKQQELFLLPEAVLLAL